MAWRIRTLALSLALAAAALSACSNGGGGSDAGPDAGLPDPICLEPGAGPYALAFADATEELGLGPSGLNIRGSLVSIGDVNGDHWPDISTSKASAARETPEAPAGLYQLFVNNGDGTFADATFTSGLFTARDGTEGRTSTFVAFADLDNDGDKDAFGAVAEDFNNTDTLLDNSSVYLNDGTGQFTIGPEQSFTSAGMDPVVGVAFLDYDHDGILDMFMGHHYGHYGYMNTTMQSPLFQGDGAGNFTDVSAAAGVATVPFSAATAADGTSHKPTWGVTTCDLDGDGWDDLLASSYGRQFNNTFRNTGGAFESMILTSGYDSDDNLDYTDNQMFRCYCEDHPDEAECDGVPGANIMCDGYSWTPSQDEQPWRLGGNSSNAVCGDVDNDGDTDVLAVELAHWWAGQSSDKTELLINEGFPETELARPGNEATGLVREHASVDWNEGDLGGLLADFDNDGRLDVLVASSDYPDTFSLLWQQQADGTFVEVGAGAGTRIVRSHGIAVLDYDRDGDYDIVSGTSLMRWGPSDDPPAPDDAYAYVLRNDSGAAANKIMLHLRGSGASGGASRDAFGARVTVTAGGVTYTREVQGPYGLDGIQNDELMIIGIGAACTADSVTVRWPNASLDEETFTDVLANYVLVVEEGQGLDYQSLAEYAPAP